MRGGRERERKKWDENGQRHLLLETDRNSYGSENSEAVPRMYSLSLYKTGLDST